jgi:hypothetical protein
LRVFERKVLQRTIGPMCENGFWHVRYNNDLCKLFSEPDIVKTIKIGRLQWPGHVIGKLNINTIKKLTLLKPDGCRRVGRPELRFMDGIQDDLRMFSVRGWRRRALDRRKWKNILQAARAQTGP